MSHLSAFRDALCKKGFDAAIITEKVNEFYLTGFDFDDGMVLVTKGKSYLITDFRYIEAAKAQASSEFEVMMPENRCRQLDVVSGYLAENGCKAVAIEDTNLSYADYLSYKEILTGYELSAGASALLKNLRLFKDEKEIETMIAAQAITDAAFDHIVKWITPNMTEMDVALELEFFMRKNGADAAAFQTIAVSGASSSKPHGVPSRKKLEKGFLTMDFGAKVGGYCSDMTRTVVLGKADAEIKEVYKTVLKAQKAALDAAREGIQCKELDAIARRIIDGTKYKGTFGHSLGHGVGLYIHEAPNFSTRAPEDSVFSRGHVVTFEPGIYIEGKYGCRIEDMGCIRHDGSFYDFTKSPKDLMELF